MLKAFAAYGRAGVVAGVGVVLAASFVGTAFTNADTPKRTAKVPVDLVACKEHKECAKGLTCGCSAPGNAETKFCCAKATEDKR